MPTEKGPLTVHIGDEELVVRKRYEVASILNDLMIAGWFTVGSFLFFSESTTYLGTWLFVIGSIQLGIRPIIRLRRHFHLRKYQPGGAAAETSQDF